jgi:FAD/FMN-containing dehydrogenase
VRASRPPSTLWDLRTELGGARFVAELGVGVVHLDAPLDRPPPAERLVALHRAVKARLDPMGRLNPGRSPLTGPDRR